MVLPGSDYRLHPSQARRTKGNRENKNKSSHSKVVPSLGAVSRVHTKQKRVNCAHF